MRVTSCTIGARSRQPATSRVAAMRDGPVQTDPHRDAFVIVPDGELEDGDRRRRRAPAHAEPVRHRGVDVANGPLTGDYAVLRRFAGGFSAAAFLAAGRAVGCRVRD